MLVESIPPSSNLPLPRMCRQHNAIYRSTISVVTCIYQKKEREGISFRSNIRCNEKTALYGGHPEAVLRWKGRVAYGWNGCGLVKREDADEMCVNAPYYTFHSPAEDYPPLLQVKIISRGLHPTSSCVDALPHSARPTGRRKLKLTSGSDVITVVVIIDGAIRTMPSMAVGGGR